MGRNLLSQFLESVLGCISVGLLQSFLTRKKAKIILKTNEFNWAKIISSLVNKF